MWKRRVVPPPDGLLADGRRSHLRLTDTCALPLADPPLYLLERVMRRGVVESGSVEATWAVMQTSAGACLCRVES